MSYLLSAAQARAVDDYTINRTGIPQAVLMERAALAVADSICSGFSKDTAVFVIYGAGNNGGDGLAAGRILSLRGYSVFAAPAVSGLDGRLSGMAAEQLKIAQKCKVEAVTADELFEYTKVNRKAVIIDAIFGIGLSRELEGEYANTVGRINKTGLPVFSVDIPSGINTDSGAVMGMAVRAEKTVTFGYLKPAHVLYPGAEYSGEVILNDIGFSAEICGLYDIPGMDGNRITYYSDKSEVPLPKRFAASNKGSYGRTLIIGGSRGMAGSVCLCAEAALIAGSGLVKLLASEDAVRAVNHRRPEIMTGVLLRDDGYDEDMLEEAMDWATVIVIGPGLGKSSAAREILRTVLASEKPAVYDADALNIIAEMTEGAINRANAISRMISGRAVLTPHIGEMSRLSGISVPEVKSDIFDITLDYAYNGRIVYVCKDARTVVSDGNEIYVNITGNNGMSTGGSGDVLSGLIGGLAAVGMKLYEASASAVYIHGAAGDRAAAVLSEDSVTAGSILEQIPYCIKELRNNE